jgi:hypothetical protein
MKTRTTIYRCLQAVGLLGFGALAPVAQAAVLINGFGTSSLFASGDAANYSMAYANGAGPGGSTAIVITTDFTGTGFGEIDYSDRYVNVTGNTSANLSDYILSFDVMAKGSAAHPGFWVVVSGDSSGLLTLSDPTSFQHFSLNLGSNLGGPALNPLSTTWQLDFNLIPPYFEGEPSVGDQFILSNVELTMVPEPSLPILALLALSGLAIRAYRNLSLKPQPS